MQDNMLLIKEINMQRAHNKAAKRVLEAQVTTTLVFAAFVVGVRVCIRPGVLPFKIIYVAMYESVCEMFWESTARHRAQQ